MGFKESQIDLMRSLWAPAGPDLQIQVFSGPIILTDTPPLPVDDMRPVPFPFSPMEMVTVGKPGASRITSEPFSCAVTLFGTDKDRSSDSKRFVSSAPGVYVGDAKVAALGLRVRGGACYHGVSLNVDMDLAPFLDIDPCGYPGMRVTQLADLGVRITPAEAGEDLAAQIMRHLAGSTEAPSTT